MMLYVRMSTLSRSARAAAFASGRTLNPMMIAFDAAASWTSFSVMPPTPFSRTCGLTASVPSRSTATAMASADLGIIIRADVQGSAEAIADAVERLATEAVQPHVLLNGAGGLTEDDVQ